MEALGLASCLFYARDCRICTSRYAMLLVLNIVSLNCGRVADSAKRLLVPPPVIIIQGLL